MGHYLLSLLWLLLLLLYSVVENSLGCRGCEIGASLAESGNASLSHIDSYFVLPRFAIVCPPLVCRRRSSSMPPVLELASRLGDHNEP